MIGGPVKDEMEFIGQYLFAADLLDFVKNCFGKKQWYIKACYGNSNGEYFADFEDYWEPHTSEKKLIPKKSCLTYHGP